jgi:hypothetical protein
MALVFLLVLVAAAVVVWLLVLTNRSSADVPAAR